MSSMDFLVSAAAIALAAGPGAAAVAASDALDLFETNQIVALGENHGMVADDAWILDLLSDPRFVATVDTLSIEFGAGTHQETMDRYIRGDAVSDAQMQSMWSDGTHSPMGVSYSPFYEALAAQIRNLNLSERQDNPVRVILGDPGVDWDADPLAPGWIQAMRDRDAYWGQATVDAVRNGDKVLMIGGFGHFTRPDGAGRIAAAEAQGYSVVVAMSAGGMSACGLDDLWAGEDYGAIIDVSQRPEGQMNAGPCFPGAMMFREGAVTPAYDGIPLAEVNAQFVWLGDPAGFAEGETFPPPADPDLAARMQERADRLGVEPIGH